MIYSSLYKVLGGRRIPPFKQIVEDIQEHLPQDKEERKAVLKELSFLTPRKCQPLLVTFTVMVYDMLFLKRYKNVSLDGVENVKRKGAQIFLSSHRSYVDSAYIQINLLKRNYEAPLILVGDNLSLFPLGSYFRRTGHFFVRRKPKNRNVSLKAFSLLIRFLVKNKYSILFFHEGTRSRMGYLTPPKTGAIKLILEVAKDYGHDLEFVPSAVNCESYLDESSQRKILSDKDKKESFVNAVKGVFKAFRGEKCLANIQLFKTIELKSEDIASRDVEGLAQDVALEANQSIAAGTTLLPLQSKILKENSFLKSHEKRVLEKVLPGFEAKIPVRSDLGIDHSGLMWWHRGVALLPLLSNASSEEDPELSLLRKMCGLKEISRQHFEKLKGAEHNIHLIKSLFKPELYALRKVMEIKNSGKGMEDPDMRQEVVCAIDKGVEGHTPMPHIMKESILNRALEVIESRP